jgi:hypothetical protein
VSAAQVRREPAWSGPLTAPLVSLVPAEWRPTVVVLIKAVHTAIFVSIAGLILRFTLDGFRGRTGRGSMVAAGVAIAEAAVYVSNNQVCPLTPLAETLGAESGTVTDIFLPDALSRRIPIISGGVLALGLVLHVRTWLGRHPRALSTR